MYTLLFVSVWLIILTYLAGYETMTRYSTLYPRIIHLCGHYLSDALEFGDMAEKDLKWFYQG